MATPQPSDHSAYLFIGAQRGHATRDIDRLRHQVFECLAQL